MSILDMHMKCQAEVSQLQDGHGLSSNSTDQTILEANKKLMEIRAAREKENSTLKQGLASIGQVVSIIEDSIDDYCQKHKQHKKKEECEIFGGLLGPKYTCEKCEHDAVEKYNKRQQEISEHEAIINFNAKQKRIKNLFSECQIGERFRGLSFDDYIPTNTKASNALMVCKQYAETFLGECGAAQTGASLIFLGKPGTGKNHLAAAICTHILAKGCPAVHTTVMKAIRRIKSTWSKDAEETEQKAILSFCEPDLLVIDEVGVQFGSDTEKLLLTEIINERYERVKPTILLTNLTASQLSESLGERIVDRFRDGGKIVVFDWESYRGRKK